MLRKLGCGVASLAIIVPSAVSALSVEDYSLNSYLSQPLDLQIKLADLKGLNESDIRISLATPEEFEAAGIEYDALHNNLNFDIDVAADGTGTVRVTTKQPLSEPFISFLVEYKWPSGRLMREYNLLLDPPTYRATEPANVTTPATTQPTATAPKSTQAPSSQPKPSSSAPTKSATRASGQEHKVSPTDTLWDIAAKNRPDSSISVQQMMVAIQELNPSAFIDNNINLVKEGAVLRLPNAEDVRQVTTREAMAEVATQNRQWQQMLESKGIVPEGTAKPLDGKEVADTEGEAKASEGGADSGRVTLVAADDSLNSSEDESATGNDSVAASEDVSRLQRENSELADRLKDLEEQLSLSEELLTLRSQQIAELESKLKELNESSADELDDEFLAAVEKLEQEQQALAEEAQVANLQTVDESSDDVEAVTEEEITEGQDLSADDQAAAADSEPEVDEGSGEEAEVQEVKDKEEATTKPVAPVVAPEPYEEPSFLGTLLENTALVFGALALLLLALALIVVRAFKGRKEQAALAVSEDEESADDFGDDPFHFDETEAPDAEELAAEAQQLIDSEQYDAAIPVLRNAINQDPSRTTLRKNLLFALYKTNESAYQQEVVAVRGTNDELDAYIAELEHEADATVEDNTLSLDDLEDDLKFDSAAPVLGEEESSEVDDELDFDFGATEEASETLSDDDFSFDLETPLEAEENDQDEGFLDDFDFSFDEDDTTSEDASDDFSLSLSDDTGLGTLELDADSDVELESEPTLELEGSTLLDDTEELPTLDLDEEEFSLDELSLEGFGEEDDSQVTAPTVAEEEADLPLDELDLSELSGSAEEPLLDTEEETFSLDDIELEDAQLDDETDSFDLSELATEDSTFELDVESQALEGTALEENADSEVASLESDDDSVDSLLAELEGFDETLKSDDLSSELEHELEQLNKGSTQTVAEPVAEDVTPATSVVEEEQYLDPEAESDPVDTRLNLARAFLDMGDEDIARETLLEVMSEGDETQKASAQAMLDELDA